jgi:hypothetical protein
LEQVWDKSALEPGKAGPPLDATCKRLLQFASLFKNLSCAYLRKFLGFMKPSLFSPVGIIPAMKKASYMGAQVKCNERIEF